MQTSAWEPPPQSQRTNRLAIAALICGIIFLFFWPLEIVTIILGHIANREIRRTGEHGRGLATTGLTLGYVVLALAAFLLVVPAVLVGFPFAAAPADLVIGLFSAMAVCLIATMITVIYRQRRRTGS